MKDAEPGKTNQPGRTKRSWRIVLPLGVAIAAILIGIAIWRQTQKPQVLAQVDLADGRIIQVEAVTYGWKHKIGNESLLLKSFGPWLPQSVRELLEPKVLQSKWDLEDPALVVWVNAIDPAKNAYVDCQGIRVEFVNKDGDLYGQKTSAWTGFGKFWRVGHLFEAFPRDEKTLKLRITSWKTKNSKVVELANPAYREAEQWRGEPLPARKKLGDYEVVLSGLNVRTNEEKYWQTPSRYLEPVVEVWRNGTKQESGWDLEWIAEDGLGNRGQFLGTRMAALRFKVTLQASATNVEAAPIVKALPTTAMDVSTNRWWNIPFKVGTEEYEVLGFFPASTYVFLEGKFQTNPPMAFGPTQGGSPSGWSGASRQKTPTRTEEYHAHYSDVPVIFIHTPKEMKGPIAMRMKDQKGRYWNAQPEPQGSSEGVLPFILRVPKEVESITPEILLPVILKSEFLVETKAAR